MHADKVQPAGMGRGHGHGGFPFHERWQAAGRQENEKRMEIHACASKSTAVANTAVVRKQSYQSRHGTTILFTKIENIECTTNLLTGDPHMLLPRFHGTEKSTKLQSRSREVRRLS